MATPEQRLDATVVRVQELGALIDQQHQGYQTLINNLNVGYGTSVNDMRTEVTNLNNGYTKSVEDMRVMVTNMNGAYTNSMNEMKNSHSIIVSRMEESVGAWTDKYMELEI